MDNPYLIYIGIFMAMLAVSSCSEKELEETPAGVITVMENGKTKFEVKEGGLHKIVLLKPHGEAGKIVSELACARYIDTCALEAYGDR